MYFKDVEFYSYLGLNYLDLLFLSVLNTGDKTYYLSTLAISQPFLFLSPHSTFLSAGYLQAKSAYFYLYISITHSNVPLFCKAHSWLWFYFIYHQGLSLYSQWASNISFPFHHHLGWVLNTVRLTVVVLPLPICHFPVYFYIPLLNKSEALLSYYCTAQKPLKVVLSLE